MITFSQKYDISAWNDTAYNSLATRTTPLTEDEAALIGTQATVKIFVLREKYRAEKSTLLGGIDAEPYPIKRARLSGPVFPVNTPRGRE